MQKSDQPHSGCRFCLANQLLVDAPLYETDTCFVLASIDPMLPAAMMIVPHLHRATPFDMSTKECTDIPALLDWVKTRLDRFDPDGYSIGWNVGTAGGQDVFHAHLHVIARFADDTNAGHGIRRDLEQPERIRRLSNQADGD